MTCYFRHLKQVFEKANIKITIENKQKIDRIIHNVVGIECKNCSAVWREVKKRIDEDEKDFVLILKSNIIEK